VQESACARTASRSVLGLRAFVDASAVANAHRRGKLADGLRFTWFDWVGELLALCVGAGIAANLMPAWVIVALVLITRRRSSLSHCGPARALDAP